MGELIFLIIFGVIVFPILLIIFQKIQKTQKDQMEANELLREIKRMLVEMNDKNSA